MSTYTLINSTRALYKATLFQKAHTVSSSLLHKLHMVVTFCFIVIITTIIIKIILLLSVETLVIPNR